MTLRLLILMTLKKLYSQLKIARTEQFKFSKAGDESSNLTDQQYEDAVASCRRGDVFQKENLSKDETFSIRSNYDYGNFKLFGSSPELQISVRDNQAVIAPIAGTVKRTGNAQDDLRLAKEMLSEHIMLYLARNDLSRSKRLK